MEAKSGTKSPACNTLAGGWAAMGLLVGLSACSPGGAPGGPGAGGPPAVSVVPAVTRQVQETDEFAAVRGARIVLSDGASADPATDAGIRAPVTAHWLAQLG